MLKSPVYATTKSTWSLMLLLRTTPWVSVVPLVVVGMRLTNPGVRVYVTPLLRLSWLLSGLSGWLNVTNEFAFQYPSRLTGETSRVPPRSAVPSGRTVSRGAENEELAM